MNLGRGWFARDADGNEIKRPATCACGQVYTQRLLSARVMAAAEAHSPRAIALMQDQIPELFVPVACPACERRDMTRHIHPASGEPFVVRTPPRITDRERFARNLAQLCAAWNRPVDPETSQIYWRALERGLTDDEFERGVIGAVRNERKWPTPAMVAYHGKVA